MGDKTRTKTPSGNHFFPQDKEFNSICAPRTSQGKTIQNEAFFQAITQNSTDIIIIVNRRGCITYVNLTVEYVMGYAPEELIGRSAFDLISKKDLSRAIYDFGKAVLTRNIIIPNVFEVMHKDGSVRILEGVGKNMFGNPSVKGFVMNVRDITERKKAEEELNAYRKRLEELVADRTAELEKSNEALRIQLSESRVVEDALRKSEERFRTLIQESSDIISILDDQTRFVFNSPSADAVFGYPPEYLLGRSPFEFIHPDDMNHVRAAYETVLNRTHTGIPTEFRFRKADGSWLHLEALGQNLFDYPGINGIVITSRDVTERKRTEEHLRERDQMIKSILSTTPVGIGLTVDRKIKWVNEAWMQIFGFEDNEACMGQPISILYASEENYEESRRRIYTILKHAKIASIEAFMIRQSGSVFPAQINVAPIDPSDLKKGAISTITDISEWKKMEQSLRESEERYRLALEATSDGLWDWDITTGVVGYSPAWYRILGETIQNLFSAWESRIHPDEKDTVLLSLKAHLEGNNDGWHLEHRLKTAEGKWKWVLGRGSVITRDKRGEPLRMVGTIIDIDDRKQLENQLVQAQKMEAIGTLAGGIAHDFNNILGSISGYTELSLLKTRSPNSRETDLRHVLTACDRAKNLVNQILLFSRQREGEKKSVDVTLIVKEALKLLRASLP
ncbi:MAG: PAS domain S-box protein, partial [Syntrophales bacterium]|nr:PAS domain S-box protein [Syntrophales bacterium]